jgi:hypothetical protein
MNKDKITFDEWYSELLKIHLLFSKNIDGMDKDSYQMYYADGFTPADTYKEEVLLSNS